MVAQVAALDYPHAFSALTLVSTRPVAPGPVDDDLPDHDAAIMDAVFSRRMPEWTDRAAVAAFAADGAALLGNDPEQAREWDARRRRRAPRRRALGARPEVCHEPPAAQCAAHPAEESRRFGACLAVVLRLQVDPGRSKTVHLRVC